MKITRSISEKLIGLEAKKAIYVLEKISTLAVDYPELYIDDAVAEYTANYPCS